MPNDSIVVFTTGDQTISGIKTFTDVPVFEAGFNLAVLNLTAVADQLTLGSGNTIKLNAPTPAASRIYSLPDVGANANFILSEGNQTINGVKTFSDVVVFLSGFSLGSLTLSNNSNQLTLAGVTLNAAPGVRTFNLDTTGIPSGASFVMTDGTQTVAGFKTFANQIIFEDNIIAQNGVIFSSRASNQLEFANNGSVATINIDATSAAQRIYTLSDAGANASFVLSEGAQTLNGAKTLTSPLSISAGSNQLVLRSGNTVTINAVEQAASRVYTIPDANQNAKFVMSESALAQSINGTVRFFDGGIQLNVFIPRIRGGR